MTNCFKIKLLSRWVSGEIFAEQNLQENGSTPGWNFMHDPPLCIFHVIEMSQGSSEMRHGKLVGARLSLQQQQQACMRPAAAAKFQQILQQVGTRTWLSKYKSSPMFSRKHLPSLVKSTAVTQNQLVSLAAATQLAAADHSKGCVLSKLIST